MKVALLFLLCPPTQLDIPADHHGDRKPQQALNSPVNEPRNSAEILFDFPISRAIGIDVDAMLRPEPSYYHFAFGPMVR